jgi:hypothetical protein
MTSKIKNRRSECKCCKGRGGMEARLINLATRTRELHTIVCPQCLGKGYCDESDSERAMSVEQFDALLPN